MSYNTKINFVNAKFDVFHCFILTNLVEIVDG